MLLDILNITNFCLGILFVMCYFFQVMYLFIPFIIKMPKHKPTVPHKYAILISARNEEAVIGTLIDSIAQQDYPSELVTVVVVADNCTDKTAEVARQRGALVYERFNTEEVGKGYALNFVLHKLDEDLGPDAFDAFIVFDADNILTKNFITEINKTFSDGYEVITTYRNSKNYGDNWLSSGTGLWFIRESKYLNGSRFRIGACPQVSGTGFLFSNNIKKQNGGWPYHTLTEDYEFTCDSVVKGIRFGYCEDARFYDEQVTGFVQAWHQRVRWCKGGMQAFIKHCGGLIKGIFSRKFVASYDMTMSIFPAYVISILACFVNIIGVTALLIAGYDPIETITSTLLMVLGAYLLLFTQSLVCTITEWRHIRAKWYKKVLYAFTFPFFIFSLIPAAFVAMFKRVEWKPIKHSDASEEERAQMEAVDEVGKHQREADDDDDGTVGEGEGASGGEGSADTDSEAGADKSVSTAPATVD